MKEFIKGCLRKEETFYMKDSDGTEVEDPSQSRFSWEEVYLHPLFNKELIDIPRETAGSEILLNIKTSAKSRSIDLIEDILMPQLGK